MVQIASQIILGAPMTELNDTLSADDLRSIARKLTTYAGIYTGDKEAREMAARCCAAARAIEITAHPNRAVAVPSEAEIAALIREHVGIAYQFADDQSGNAKPDTLHLHAEGAAHVIAHRMRACSPDSVPVPDGYQLAPASATQAMCDAGRHSWMHDQGPKASPMWGSEAADIYRAMIKAAPTLPSG